MRTIFIRNNVLYFNECTKGTKNAIIHYGIKGMKWGVRRTKEELSHDPYSIQSTLNRNLSKVKTPNGVKVNYVSDHFMDRLNENRPDRVATAKDVIDALEHPVNKEFKVRYDVYNRPSIRYIGEKATVNVNPITGCIATFWKSSSKYSRRSNTNV